MDRRKFLAALGTIGAGAGAATLFGDHRVVQNYRHDVEEAVGMEEQLPPNPATSGRSRPEPDVPWVGPGKEEGRTLTVGHSREKSPHYMDDVQDIKEGRYTVKFDKLMVGKAVEFWDEYINQNESFNLSLSYDPAADDNADILIQPTPNKYPPKYQNLSKVEGIKNQLAVETLTEEPEDKPAIAKVGKCGQGPGTFKHVASHGLGRLLGYPIWAEPVRVMTPKLNAVLEKPAYNKEIYRHFLLFGWYHGRMSVEPHLVEEAWPDNGFSSWEEIREVQIALDRNLSRMDHSYKKILGLLKELDHPRPLLVEGMKKKIPDSEDEEYIRKTKRIAESVRASKIYDKSLSEVKKTEQWEEFKSRCKVIMNEFPQDERWDRQVHRYWANEMWDRHME